MVSYDEETIVAQATPHGSGALAIVRLSGTHVLDIVTSISCLSLGKKLCDVPTHTIHLGSVLDRNNTLIDRSYFW